MSGRPVRYLPLEPDNPAIRWNARGDLSGTFWIGTMGRSAEPGAGVPPGQTSRQAGAGMMRPSSFRAVVRGLLRNRKVWRII